MDQSLHIVIRYCGLSILDRVVPPGSYRVGRARDNELRVLGNFLSRHHGRVSSVDGVWWYEDLRPKGRSGRVRIEPRGVIALGNNLELVQAEELDHEPTREDRVTDLQKALRVARGGPLPWQLGAAAAVALAVAAGTFYWTQQGARPMDVSDLLTLVRPSIVELEMPRDTKGRSDYRRYAGLGDADFVDTLGFCTGFVVAPKVVVTANRCVQGGLPFGASTPFKLKTEGGALHEPGRLLGFDAKRDYAFLEAPSIVAPPLVVSPDFEVGARVFTIGSVAGEGLAIREGILASKAPDEDEPEVEFLRFTAAASPGMSGGPLLNARGQVLALVFARASLSESSTRATAGKDLLEAKRRFVDDTASKRITVRLKDLGLVRPEALLPMLRLPFDPEWRDSPESLRPLQEVVAELALPAPLADFTKEAVTAMSTGLAQAHDAVRLDPRNKARGFDWASELPEGGSIIVPGQLGSLVASLHVEATTELLRPSPAVMTPPLRYGTGRDAATDGRPFEAVSIGTYTLSSRVEATPRPETRHSSDERSGKRALVALAYQPIVSARTHAAEPSDGWRATRVVNEAAVLADVGGEAGLIAAADASYVRPKSQREFTIASLDEKLRESRIKDGLGREWQVFDAELFDSYSLESYCQALPQGSLCLTTMAPLAHGELRAVARRNFARLGLSQYLVEPAFWRVDALLDYIAAGLHEQDPLMRDFRLSRDASGDLVVTHGGFGLAVTYPKDEEPAMLRLVGGLVRGGGEPRWVAVAHQAYFKEKGGKRICDVGVELEGSRSIVMLETIRQRQRLWSKVKAKDGDDPELPLPPGMLFSTKLEAVEGDRGGMLYGYCLPLSAGNGGGHALDFYVPKPFQVAFKRTR